LKKDKLIGYFLLTAGFITSALGHIAHGDHWDNPDFQRYCPTRPNSTGWPAEIDFEGSNSTGTNYLVVKCRNIPRGQNAILAWGYGGVPGYPFGNGNLCLDMWQGVVSFRDMQISNEMGFTSLRILPYPDFPLQIQPGTTFYYQWFFRDPVDAGFNSSDGMSITYRQ
jgi:hypothetical protein